MRVQSIQEKVENQFDYICKRAMLDERKNYFKHLSTIKKKEISFSEYDEYYIKNFSTNDYYSINFEFFNIFGIPIPIENDLLSKALKKVTKKSFQIILLYYFIGMNDSEIGQFLNLNRSTVNRHRSNGLKIIRQYMEEN